MFLICLFFCLDAWKELGCWSLIPMWIAAYPVFNGTTLTVREVYDSIRKDWKGWLGRVLVIYSWRPAFRAPSTHIKSQGCLKSKDWGGRDSKSFRLTGRLPGFSSELQVHWDPVSKSKVKNIWKNTYDFHMCMHLYTRVCLYKHVHTSLHMCILR